MKIFIAFILTIIAFNSNAEEWKYQRSQLSSLVGNNYIDFTKHNGKIYYATNYNYKRYYSAGLLWMQSSDELTSRLSTAWSPIPKSDLAQYKDIWDQPMTYIRTIGLESYGGQCHALLHVGATYGLPNYYYVPAYATSSDCINWTYHGPVNIEGTQALRIFSSSAAYFIEDGIHYMAQDAGSYGRGKLVIWRSEDGINYEQHSDDLNAVSSDRPVFPDMEACNGLYHLLYENGYNRDGYVIRHLTSTNTLDWDVETLNLGLGWYSFKGINVSCIDNELYGIMYRRLYKWVE